MATIIDEILSKVPRDAKISSTKYEGANIVLYTKSKRFFKYGGDIIYKLVEDFKKRIELRADPSIRVSEEKTLVTQIIESKEQPSIKKQVSYTPRITLINDYNSTIKVADEGIELLDIQAEKTFDKSELKSYEADTFKETIKITNCSTLNFLSVKVFLMIVRFFCSTRTVSPELISSHSALILTENEFPLGILIIAVLSPKTSTTSQTINGFDLNLSSSFLNWLTVSLNMRFSSSNEEV